MNEIKKDTHEKYCYSDTVFESLKAKLLPYKDTLVIDMPSFKVVRLVDVISVSAEDDDWGVGDYYWVYDWIREMSNDHITMKQSCVLGWLPLKGVMPDGDYETMLYFWNLNSEDKAI